MSGGRADALLVVEVLFVVGDRHDVRQHVAFFADHAAVLLAQQGVAEPIVVVLLRIIGAHVIEPPAALGPVPWSARIRRRIRRTRCVRSTGRFPRYASRSSPGDSPYPCPRGTDRASGARPCAACARSR